jgi:uncharacterized membrane protein YheB (UPF0754 family)
MVLTFGVGNHEWWKYLIMPFMSGLVGYGTNVLALEMTFRPIEYFGLNLWRMNEQPWGLFGWQGIIPTKAAKMAAICSEMMTQKLFNLREIFSKLDPDRFYTVMEDGLLILIDDILNDVASVYMPDTWKYMPDRVKNEVVLSAHRACPDFLRAFIIDMTENIHNVLDIKEMCVDACVENKEIVNKVFLECGDKVRKYMFLISVITDTLCDRLTQLTVSFS